MSDLLIIELFLVEWSDFKLNRNQCELFPLLMVLQMESLILP